MTVTYRERKGKEKKKKKKDATEERDKWRIQTNPQFFIIWRQ